MIQDFIINGIIGGQEILIIVLIILILFGAKKIPDLMKGVGKGVKEFKDATSEKEDNKKDNSTQKK